MFITQFQSGCVIGLKKVGLATRRNAQHLGDETTGRVWGKNLWINNGRFKRQNSSGRPRTTAEREGRVIVRSAISASDSSLSTIRRVIRSLISNMTIDRLRKRNLRSYRLLYLYASHLYAVKPNYSGTLARSIWNYADWGRIGLRDVFHFLLRPDDHRRRFWRRPE